MAHRRFVINFLPTVYNGTVDVGDHGVSVGDRSVGIGDHSMSVGDRGMSVRHHGMSIGDHSMSAGNSHMRIDSKFHLGMPSYKKSYAEAMGHTLKT